MIGYNSLQGFAAELLVPAKVDEARARVAISAIYYGLFHHLTETASAVFDHGGLSGTILSAQAGRAFSHTLMRKVCDIYVHSTRQQRFPPPLDRLHAGPPDNRLIEIADVFIRIREARETADYDLRTTIGQAEAQSLLEQTEIAHWHLDQIRDFPETRIFLAALLLSDRWTRRA